MKKECEQCKKIFNAKRSIRRFCGNSCSVKWQNLNYPKHKTCFKKGHESWNTGLKKSGMSGRRHSKKTKEKMRRSSLGELSSLWRGGVSTKNELARKSSAYKEWRTLVFTRDNYTCQLCGARFEKGNRVILNADHIKPFSSYPEKRFDVKNGRTLCVTCHRKTETYGIRKKVTGGKAVKICPLSTPEKKS